MQKVGELQCNGRFSIMEDNEEFFLENEDGRKPFPFGQRFLFLFQPMEEVRAYQDEKGLHYVCPVCEGVQTDLFAPDIESLMNLMCRMLNPPDRVLGYLHSPSAG